ncbi:MAG: TIGR04282 family arsenosugar biosynthesis glycosyltransferase [Acidimicrobiales bacterium]
MRAGLFVMAKQPISGSSKTRLTPALSLVEAADLSRCFVLDTIELAIDVAAEHADLEVFVAGAPATSESWFAEHCPGVHFVAQRGERLGVRLDNVLTDGLAGGNDLVLAMNSDSPTLPPSNLADGLRRLGDEAVDVVLGPAQDGGYYLIGWKRPHSRLVREVEMSTPTVLRDTLAVAADEGLRVELLDTWYDVDEPADLSRVRADLVRGRRCGPHTAEFFAGRPGLGAVPGAGRAPHESSVR